MLSLSDDLRPFLAKETLFRIEDKNGESAKLHQFEKLVFTLYSPNLLCRNFASIYSWLVLRDEMSEPTFVRTNDRN